MRCSSLTIRIAVGEERLNVMAIEHSSSEKPGCAAGGKKPYQKPTFRFEQAFVTSALTCSKAGDQGQCLLNPPTRVS